MGESMDANMFEFQYAIYALYEGLKLKRRVIKTTLR